MLIRINAVSLLLLLCISVSHRSENCNLFLKFVLKNEDLDLGGANQNVLQFKLYQSPIRWSLSEQEK